MGCRWESFVITKDVMEQKEREGACSSGSYLGVVGDGWEGMVFGE